MKQFEKDIPANKKEWLIQKYFVEELSLREIAFLCDVSDDTIRTRLTRFEIPIRGYSQANKISVSKKPEKYTITPALIRRHELLKTGGDVLCKNCGCSFYVTLGKLSERKFCSTSCYREWKKQNRIEQDGWRDLPEYGEWRNAVYERDEWKCFICNSKEKINAHHIYFGRDYPEKRFIIENGITLCESHHIMLHKHSRSFAKELVKQIPNIGETPEKDNPEALIRKTLWAVTTTKGQPERLMG